MSLLAEYHLYIMGAVLVALFFLPAEYRKRKLFKIVVVLIAFSIGYELAMDETVLKMPGTINRALNQKQETNQNKHYYKEPPKGL